MSIERDFTLILRHLVDAFERRNSKEIARIRSVILDKERDSKRPQASKGRSRRKINAESLRFEFSEFQSRDELSDHIRNLYPAKADVEAVARALRLPVMKTDNTDTLVERVVGATLGYKLRSSAIRGDREDRE